MERVQACVYNAQTASPLFIYTVGTMYSPKSIANFFLSLARERGAALDPMKLQKLVYYAHGWYAGYTGNPLLDEPIEAWPYGPVVPSLYHEFKEFGRRPIDRLATSFDWNAPAALVVPPPTDPNLRNFLTNVWDKYSGYSAGMLSEMTHAPGSPWDITMREAGGMRGVDIRHELMRQHFQAAVQNTRQA